MSLISFDKGIWRQLATAIVVLAVLIAVQFWLWPFVQAGAQKVHDRQTEAQQLSELLQRLTVIEHEHEAQLPLIEQLIVVFPSQNETSQVVDRLEQLADKHSLQFKIQNIATEAATNKQASDKLVPLVVTLNLHGQVSKLLQYIDAVEHIQEIAIIRSWKLNLLATPQATPTPTTGPSPLIPQPVFPTYQLTMSIVFYLQK